MAKCIADFEIFHLLSILPISKKGVVVECGALDGVSGSAGVLFELAGMTTINIEPNPRAYAELVELRPRSINVNCALGSSDSTLKLVVPQDVGPSDLFSARTSFQLDGSYWRDELGLQIREYEVALKPFANIAQTHVPGREIDIFILDVEGFELEVISGMRGSKILPKHIFIEVDKVELSAVRAELDSLANYRLITCFKGNAIFTRVSIGVLPFLYVKCYSLIFDRADKLARHCLKKIIPNFLIEKRRQALRKNKL